MTNMFRIYQREQNRKSVKIILVICALVVGSSVATASLSYSVIEDYKTWIDAESLCRSKNGIMATPSNLNQLKQALIPFTNGEFWIGGYRRGGYWMWISDLLRRGCFKEKYTSFQAKRIYQCAYHCNKDSRWTGYIAHRDNLCICFNEILYEMPPRGYYCPRTVTSYVYYYYSGWNYNYKGCFAVPSYSKSEKNSVQECSQICAAYSFFSLQGNICVCLIDYYLPSESANDSDCDEQCAGNPVDICGGLNTNAVTVYKRIGNVRYVNLTVTPLHGEANLDGNCLFLYKHTDGSLSATPGNCYKELQFICQLASNTGSPHPTETLNTLPSSGSDNENAVGSKTGMYAGIGVGIVILGVVGVVALIVWKRKYLTRRKKPVNFQMNEINSEHMNTERSQHNQNPNDTAMNNTYALTNHSKSADGILDITSHPSADTYGKIWMSSSAGNNTDDEYSYAQHNEPADYDYAFARPQETDTTPARSESTEYDKLGVIKTSDNYESTGNTYCYAGQGTDAYTTSAKENPSDMTENDYRHLGTDEDMYEMEKNTSSRPFSDTYTHIKDA